MSNGICPRPSTGDQGGESMKILLVNDSDNHLVKPFTQEALKEKSAL